MIKMYIPRIVGSIIISQTNTTENIFIANRSAKHKQLYG